MSFVKTKLINFEEISDVKKLYLLKASKDEDVILNEAQLLTTAMVYVRKPIIEDAEITVGIYELDNKNFIELFDTNLKILSDKKTSMCWSRGTTSVIMSTKATVCVKLKKGKVPLEALRIRTIITQF